MFHTNVWKIDWQFRNCTNLPHFYELLTSCSTLEGGRPQIERTRKLIVRSVDLEIEVDLPHLRAPKVWKGGVRRIHVESYRDNAK